MASWQPRRYSDQTATKIDVAVRAIVDRAFARAVSILEQNRALLDRGAKDLLAQETLGEDKLASLAAALNKDKVASLPAVAGKATTV